MNLISVQNQTERRKASVNSYLVGYLIYFPNLLFSVKSNYFNHLLVK
ncbi:hypothetical protein THF1C08_10563 [Vibrio jasicida]|uniref:Uncharacterized protein n=1 Tax=Vibrio jasicida TaxID=766224 RepID=A0AAU9QEL9_9VIBR|nr:hypothetical protein THF1C08_10563 [Vibrio jasicida]CAH1567196.1 hypothetical protein THF1A12_10565 [Vibrio jasicida]